VIRVLRGVKRSELGGLLTRITREATAASPEARDSPTRVLWPHLRLYPLNYAQLELIEEDEEDQAMAAEAGDAWAQRLWLNLARAALAEDEVEEDADVDPLTVAVAIDARPYDPEYDRRILASLTDFAEACRGRGRSELVAVQRHLARLIGALSRPTLQRLLALRGDGALQRHFLLEVSHVMAADVVLGLVQQAKAYEQLAVAAAVTGDRGIALKALLANPLVGRYELAAQLLDAILEANRELLPEFFGSHDPASPPR